MQSMGKYRLKLLQSDLHLCLVSRPLLSTKAAQIDKHRAAFLTSSDENNLRIDHFSSCSRLHPAPAQAFGDRVRG